MQRCKYAIIKEGQRSEGRTHLPDLRLLHGRLRLPGRSFARTNREGGSMWKETVFSDYDRIAIAAPDSMPGSGVRCAGGIGLAACF
jgi:hypothetical protein